MSCVLRRSSNAARGLVCVRRVHAAEFGRRARVRSRRVTGLVFGLPCESRGDKVASCDYNVVVQLADGKFSQLREGLAGAARKGCPCKKKCDWIGSEEYGMWACAADAEFD